MRVFATETPRRADEFVDSMGINTNLNFLAATYNQSLVGQLGIRHFRSNVKPTPSTLLTRLMSLYSDYGYRVNVVCDSTAYSPSQYCGLLAGATFESIEGLNEPDVSGPRSYSGLTDNWTTQSYPATIAFQKDLFTGMASQESTSGKPVLSPAMANPLYSHFLRSAPADYIAIHSYPAQLLPTGNFISSFILPSAQLMATPGAGVMRLIATETGYQSGDLSGEISNLASSKYIPRIFAEYFRLGIVRTFLFDLADAPGGMQYGLLDYTFNPKPAFTTVKNLTGMLSESTWDPGTGVLTSPGFNPGVLDYTMTGANSSIHHVLLQKSNGVSYLLLWQEVPSYDLVGNVDINNPTIPVQLNFNTPMSTASVYRLESRTPIATFNNPQSVTINVPDEIVIVQLVPGTESSSTGTVVSMVATPAGSSISPQTTGSFMIARTGSAAAPLDVSYSIGGTAINGVDYDGIMSSVQIPEGSMTAAIPIVPSNPLIVGGKEVVLSVSPSSSYSTAPRMSSKVYINSSRTVVADFESGIQGWTGNTYSAVSLDRANADTGSGALKWIYNDDGVDRWANTVELSFAVPEDWTAVSRLELRIKENSSNSPTDIGEPVYFAWFNNGVGVGGGYGVAKFPLANDSSYRTISLDLGDFPRDKVNFLMFYVDGKALVPGTHTFYIDNICAITDTNGVLDDIEQYAGTNWTGSAQSSPTADSQNADTGVWGLKWTFIDDGITRWNNFIGINCTPPSDLTRYSTLSLRFKEDAANPIADIGEKVFLDFIDNGTSTSGGAGVASFNFTGSNSYRTIELPLGSFNRDKVGFLYFFVDGSKLAPGKHIWYIDNISYY